MPARAVSVVVVCTGISLAVAYLSQAQEATSANLPDQFQTGEMIQIQKSKKKKSQSASSTVAIAPNEDTAPVPEQMPAIKEPPTHIAPPEEKKTELNHNPDAIPPSQKLAAPTEQVSPSEEPEEVAAPVARKHRVRKRQRHVAERVAPSISEPVPVSLSVAQSMAITAPMPDYTYEMKRRNLAGNGVCLVTVDQATGTVTNATMSQSTGSPLLDKATTQTFKTWRFKSGTISQVRIPITYE